MSFKVMMREGLLICYAMSHYTALQNGFCVEWEEHSEVWITIDGECMHMIKFCRSWLGCTKKRA